MKYLRCIAFLLLLPACVEEQAQNEPLTLSELMKTHFAFAEDMRDAIVNGDVVSLHQSAKQLSKPVPVKDLPDQWKAYLDGMRAAAARLDGEYDIARAAGKFTALAGACANCHQVAGVLPAVKAYPAPPPDLDVETHMLRHAWAAARMWEGLIVPSDEKWRTGAAIVASEPLSRHNDTDGTSQFAELSTELHQLGVKAVNTTTQSERAVLYADFIGRCARCHSTFRSAKPPQ